MNILSEMKFNDFIEFMSNRKILRIYYAFLTIEEKRKYKEYIYSLNIKEYVLDMIWQFFNEPKGSVDYVYDYQLVQLLKLCMRNKGYLSKK